MYEYGLFRWMHAVCQNLNTEEEVESVADIGFDCSMCRPYMPASNGEKAVPAAGGLHTDPLCTKLSSGRGFC